MNFTYPEFSEAFKLLYTFSNLSWEDTPCPVFKRKEGGKFYTSKFIRGIELVLVEKEFKGYVGVSLEILDLLKNKKINSKYIKADFISKIGNKTCDFDNKTITSIDEFYPTCYGDLHSGLHYSPFQNSFKNKIYYLDTFLPWDNNYELKLGFYQSEDLNIKNAQEKKVYKILKREYEKLWKEDFHQASKYLNV
ncbi:hypothetical protein [Lacinutrix sp. Hel_I_90]|uniref:hypothetical protein n=1 Tax=Lacinutrix sp. Hel_I_90 TaxID=1249999 RepID=UPI0005CB59CA|nr:hypothetical protein [Lacinutrix sp. Hel_I_90]